MGDFWSDFFGGGSKGDSGGGKSAGSTGIAMIDNLVSADKAGSSGGKSGGESGRSDGGYSPGEFLSGLLRGSSPGTRASVQAKGEVDHPHPHGGGGKTHTDGWAGRVKGDGSVSVSKIHSDDKAK